MSRLECDRVVDGETTNRFLGSQKSKSDSNEVDLGIGDGEGESDGHETAESKSDV